MPVTIIPVERPAVERIPVIVLDPDVVVPLLSVKVRGVTVLRARTLAGDMVKSVPLTSMVAIVVPAGIPVPLTVVPTFILAVEGTVNVFAAVIVPLVSVKVSGTALPAPPTAGVTAGVVRVMVVPSTTFAIVVPAGIPAPLTAVPAIKPTVEGSVTVVEASVTVPVAVAVVLVAVTV
jgi:hypothetical protein